MSVPNLPGKHDEPAVVTPRASVERFYGGDHDPVPAGLVILTDDGFFERVVEERGTTPIEVPWGDCHALEEHPAVGVVCTDGVGAPATVLAMEELIVRGGEQFVSVGRAAGLQPDAGAGDLVVADRALRDEGTSYHYLAPAPYVDAPGSTSDRLAATLADRGEPFRTGPTWSIDAPYRETAAEIERYRDEGILVVDMEAAAVFAVGRRRDVTAGALFAVSEVLDPSGWEPTTVAPDDDLDRAFEAAVAALDRD